MAITRTVVGQWIVEANLLQGPRDHPILIYRRTCQVIKLYILDYFIVIEGPMQIVIKSSIRFYGFWNYIWVQMSSVFFFFISKSSPFTFIPQSPLPTLSKCCALAFEIVNEVSRTLKESGSSSCSLFVLNRSDWAVLTACCSKQGSTGVPPRGTTCAFQILPRTPSESQVSVYDTTYTLIFHLLSH